MKKKKNQIHEFNMDIYPRVLWIVFDEPLEFINKYFDIPECDSDSWHKDGGILAQCVPTMDKTDGRLGILVMFRGKKTVSVSTIAHESVHVADYIFEEIGAYSQDFKERNEPYAFLVGYIADCIWGIVKSK
jgi:hypothetical protein